MRDTSLASATQAIGATQAELRAAHLKYHLSTVEVLTSDQVRLYEEMRGYTGDVQDGIGQGGHERQSAHPN